MKVRQPGRSRGGTRDQQPLLLQDSTEPRPPLTTASPPSEYPHIIAVTLCCVCGGSQLLCCLDVHRRQEVQLQFQAGTSHSAFSISASTAAADAREKGKQRQMPAAAASARRREGVRKLTFTIWATSATTKCSCMWKWKHKHRLTSCSSTANYCRALNMLEQAFHAASPRIIFMTIQTAVHQGPQVLCE